MLQYLKTESPTETPMDLNYFTSYLQAGIRPQEFALIETYLECFYFIF